MDQINKLFYSLSNLDAVLDAIAAIEQFTSAETHLHRETWSHGIAYRCKHLTDDADTVLQRASIFIGTMIQIGRKELVQ